MVYYTKCTCIFFQLTQNFIFLKKELDAILLSYANWISSELVAGWVKLSKCIESGWKEKNTSRELQKLTIDVLKIDRCGTPLINETRMKRQKKYIIDSNILLKSCRFLKKQVEENAVSLGDCIV